jgi:hypothetical protein
MFWPHNLGIFQSQTWIQDDASSSACLLLCCSSPLYVTLVVSNLQQRQCSPKCCGRHLAQLHGKTACHTAQSPANCIGKGAFFSRDSMDLTSSWSSRMSRFFVSLSLGVVFLNLFNGCKSCTCTHMLNVIYSLYMT